MTSLDRTSLEMLVEELCGWDAMELIFQPMQEKEKRGLVLIPYVMNDAVECFLELTDASVKGVWNPEFEGDVTYHLTENEEGRNGLFLYQGDENVTSIWFGEAFRHLNCYQYHNIGHMWRKEAGEEHLRRLVHLICVIHDKWNYLGAEACNEEEMQLYALAEFSPLRYWTPINESILKWYGDSKEGAGAFVKLAGEIGDDELVREGQKYLTAVSQDKVPEHQMVRLAKKLAEPDFLEKGYTGQYPVLENAYEWIHLVEEQPFTVMESDDYQFQIMELHIGKKKEAKPWFLGKRKTMVEIKKWSK